MTSTQRYFRNIYDTVKSVAIGMRITLRYCFQKTVVVQYPEQRLALAPRYRGIHEFEDEKCIACDLCAKACPVDCIYIDKTGPRKIDKATGTVNSADPKNGQLVRFAIDYSKCLFLRPLHRAVPDGVHSHGQASRSEQLQPGRCGSGVCGVSQEESANPVAIMDGAERGEDRLGEGGERPGKIREVGDASGRYFTGEMTRR